MKLCPLPPLRALLAPLFLFTLSAAARADEPRPLAVPNLGFEEALTHWDVRERIIPMSTAVAEAARSGGLGLRIVDEDTQRGSSAETQGFIVTPGYLYRATFWARSERAIAAAYLHFHRMGDNQRLPDPAVRVISGTGDEWQEFMVEAVAPADAGLGVLEFHSFNKSVGQVDVDDIVIVEMSAVVTSSAAAAATAPALAAAAAPVRTSGAFASVPVGVAAGKSAAPYVVVKLDDVNTSPSGWLSDKWRRVGDFAAQRQIRLSLGVITRSLETPKPEYLAWLRAMRDSGWIEFWFHAYDHATHVGADGRPRSEFADRDPAELKRRFDLSQELAVQHLGAPFVAFGPPGGGETAHVNADTLRAVEEDPNLRVILYPSPIDEIGEALEARGKVRVLDRVWQVNIEQPLFKPNYEKFVQGYERYAPGRDYLVIQGHPNRWDDERFAEFERIIDFLVSQGARFVGAAELGERLANDGALSARLASTDS